MVKDTQCKNLIERKETHREKCKENTATSTLTFCGFFYLFLERIIVRIRSAFFWSASERFCFKTPTIKSISVLSNPTPFFWAATEAAIREEAKSVGEEERS